MGGRAGVLRSITLQSGWVDGDGNGTFSLRTDSSVCGVLLSDVNGD